MIMTTKTIKTAIRLASENDVDVLARFEVQSAKETEQYCLDFATARNAIAYFVNSWDKGFYLVMEANKEDLVGCVRVTKDFATWENSEIWWLRSMFVQPNYRRKNVATQLCKEIIKMSSKHACSVRLFVDKHNSNAKSLYKSLGFMESRYELYEMRVI